MSSSILSKTRLSKNAPFPLLLLPSPPPPPPAAVPPSPGDVDRLANLINSTPTSKLHSLFLHSRLPSLLSSSPLLLPSLLSRLFHSHSQSSKSLTLFLFSLSHHHPPSPESFHTTLHILSRARDFSSAVSLLQKVITDHPSHSASLLTPKSLAILLSRHAKFQPFLQTLSFFSSLENLYSQAGIPFSVPHFNSLLRSFSSLGRVAQARSLFLRLHHRFPLHSSTLNTLLLAFKEAGDVLAFDVFYNDMLLRGFSPDIVTHNIRIDAYCKMNRFHLALELYEEMLKITGFGLSPTVETLTTLVHGAGIVRNPFFARRLFDEMHERGLEVDRGAYNALMGALVRAGDLKGAMELVGEMDEKGFGMDDVSYYTLFCGLKKRGDMEGVCGLYREMAERMFVPRVRTVMLLTRLFCESGRAGDLGLELWKYLVERGCCPHPDALDLLVTGLCCGKKVEEAFECFTQLVERGRRPSERTVLMLEGVLMRSNERGKLEELKKMMELLGPLPSRSLENDLE